jgi:hypothetical protein
MTEHKTGKTNDGQQAKPNVNYVVVQVAVERQRIGRRLMGSWYASLWRQYHVTAAQFGWDTRVMGVRTLLGYMVTVSPTRYMYHLRRI